MKKFLRYSMLVVVFLMTAVNANAGWDFESVTPAAGTVEKIGKITLVPSVGSINEMSILFQLSKPDGSTQSVSFSVSFSDWRTLNSDGDLNLTAPGTYTLTIPAGSLSEFGTLTPNNATTFTWTIVGSSTPDPEPDPEPDSDPTIEGMIHFYSAESVQNIPAHINNGITYSATNGGFMVAPLYQTYGGKSLWIYNKNTVTFGAPEGKLIDRIVFKTIEGYKGAANVDNGMFDANSGEWTNADGAKSVTFTMTDNMHATDIYINLIDAPQVTVSSAKWATYVLTCNASFKDSGVKAYAVSEVSNYVKLTEIEEATEGDAVVLSAEEGTYSLTPKSSAIAPTINLLTSSSSEIYVYEAKKYYILANGDKGVGFYPVDIFTRILANKGYLEITNTSLAKPMFGFGFDDVVTDVQGVVFEKLDGSCEVYDLQGHRLQQMQKGINIVNGKKVLVK